MNINEITENSYKFFNCKYRSLEEETIKVKRCSCKGGDYESKGYVCYKKNLFKLNSKTCEDCELFESKN